MIYLTNVVAFVIFLIIILPGAVVVLPLRSWDGVGRGSFKSTIIWIIRLVVIRGWSGRWLFLLEWSGLRCGRVGIALVDVFDLTTCYIGDCSSRLVAVGIGWVRLQRSLWCQRRAHSPVVWIIWSHL